jgi:SAM-dependent methyltransferase
VGGGPVRESEIELTLNIGPFPNVDLVGDGQRIPVADATFDGVFSVAVLEHVPDAPRVVSEMMRVLKPGGWLYSEVPFIFFFHGYPSDFQRYTLEGMKRLFAGLEEARFGLTHGPVSAALQSGNMALQLLVPARPRLLRKAFNGAYRLALFPFKYLDLLLRDHPEAHVAAGGFYVIGRKPRGTGG